MARHSLVGRAVVSLLAVTVAMAWVGDPAAPATGPAFTVVRVPGSARSEFIAAPVSLVANFAGDSHDDVFLYRPGTAPDTLTVMRGDGASTVRRADINGRYSPLIGDFGGDTHDDIIWYRSGAGADIIWISRGDGTFARHSLIRTEFYRPLVGDFDGNGVDDVLWWGPSDRPDELWSFARNGSHTTKALKIGANTQVRPLVANFTGSSAEDILWHDPISSPTVLWTSTPTGFQASTVALPQGRFGVGYFGGDGHADLIDYRTSHGEDGVWFGAPAGLTRGPGLGFHPADAGDVLVGNFDGTGADDILEPRSFYPPGPLRLWRGVGKGQFSKVPDALAPKGLLSPTHGEPYIDLPYMDQPRLVGDIADAGAVATDDVALYSIFLPAEFPGVPALIDDVLFLGRP